MIMIPPPPGGDPWDGPMPANGMDWRERERRQRTVRLLLMFLMMLLLMDSEEQSARSRRSRSSRLRQQKPKRVAPLDEDLFAARQAQEAQIQKVTRTHPRYQALLERNENVDHEEQVRQWAEGQEKEEGSKDANGEDDEQHDVENSTNEADGEGSVLQKRVFHYPWNTTGFYRGEWSRQVPAEDEDGSATKGAAAADSVQPAQSDQVTQYRSPVEVEKSMKELLAERKDRLGVFLLPANVEMKMPENFTATNSELPGATVARDALRSQVANLPKSPWVRMSHPELNVLVEKAEDESPPSELPLRKPSGRAAFQLYSRSIPAMQELSLVDGFIKLYDSSSVGYSTRRDVLLRVRGVMIHSIGRMSLVANVSPGRSALVLSESPSKGERRRRLQEALADVDLPTSDHSIEQVRDQVLGLYPPEQQPVSGESWKRITSADLVEDFGADLESRNSLRSFGKAMLGHVSAFPRNLAVSDAVNASSTSTPDDMELRAIEKVPKNESAVKGIMSSEAENNTALSEARRTQSTEGTSAVSTTKKKKSVAKRSALADSKVILPYPFVYDDLQESVRKAKTPASRVMPAREQVLEANAGQCEFEINLDVREIEWSVEEWRKLVSRHVHETHELNPSLRKPKSEEEADKEEDTEGDHRPRTTPPYTRSTRGRRKAIEDAALAMVITGSIVSPNCDFVSTVNATAIRTDWELTTGKAINYSFYMMLTCLTQIVVLLRQLLHSQSQSAAIRVSLLAVGWQTVLDALLCLAHIYLSLAMQPLFTAFASVAFFKLLIFCVIEMKYMAIIIQARNNASGGSATAEVLRRQLAMLHLRFYAAVMAAFFLFFYAAETYRSLYMLTLYSFWIPQIVQNVITESKRPLHPYYIYGMSLTRLVSPLYIYAAPNNFLKEVYPDAPTDGHMCHLLILWVGLQTAVLIVQSKYGARFMIPARFLPPKFDYSRPLPESMLPPEPPESPPPLVDSERTTEMQALLPSEGSTSPNRPSLSTGTRNRNRRNTTRTESTMTTEEPVHDHSPASTSSSSLDCVICYNAIDVHNRRGYMLAPCDHVFHRECLVQWMDVKMECPICRTELPPL